MKKPSIAYIVLATVFIALLAGCGRHAQQDIGAILESALLAFIA